jgi:uncharacterized protein (DUF1778 family)
MARHKRDYSGENVTARINFKCTPSQRRELIDAARRRAATISDFTREIVFAHLTNTPIAAIPIRDVHTDTQLSKTTHALDQVGNLLNQIARRADMTNDLGPFAAHLRQAIFTIDHAGDKLLAAAGNPIIVARRLDAHTEAQLSQARHTLDRTGNLLNQIARHVNVTNELGPFAADLREAITTVEHAAHMLLAAAEKLITG